MPYRRTENVVRRLAARHDAIIAAARQIASEGGMAAVQIAAVAARAGIAAGTVYRYFPARPTSSRRCLAESPTARSARCAAPPPARPGRSPALSAAIMTFAARALRERGCLLQPSPSRSMPNSTRRGVAFRKSLAANSPARIAAAIAEGRLPQQDVARGRGRRSPAC